MTSLQPPPVKYNLGPVKPWVQNAAYVIGTRFNIKTVYGWEKVDPYGFPDHPSGHALDFMLPTPNKVPDKATGDALAAFVIANSNALGVKYLIWNRRYWSPETGWQPYTATSNPHTDHVHVTFNDQPPLGSGDQQYQLASADLSGTQLSGDDTTCAWMISAGPLAGCIISKDTLGRVVGSFILLGGAITLGAGIVLLLVFGMRQTNVPGASLITRYIPR